MTARLRLPLLLLLAALAFGCSRRHSFSQADLDRARTALQTALDSWKKGEMPERLRALAEPIEFAEEGPRNGLRLLDFQIVDDRHTDAQTIRFTVKLTVQDRRGRREQREATYAVGLKSPIVIGRDPYF
jgi:hypothetical protein